MRKNNTPPTSGGLTPKQSRARDLLAVLDADPSKTGRTPDKHKAARAAVTKLAHLAGTPRKENNAETFAAACTALNTSDDRKAQELAKRRVNDVLRAFGKLPQTIEPWDVGRGEGLREMFSDEDAVSSEKGTEVSTALHTLARLLRVELPDSPDGLPEFYLRAIRELEGDVHADEALKTVSNVPARWSFQRERAGREEGEEAKPEKRQPGQQKGTRRIEILEIPYGPDHDRLRILGLIPGDSCKVYEADDLKPGDAAGVTFKGNEEMISGRVVSVDADHITLRDDEGESTHSLAGAEFVGRIDHLNPTKIDPLPKEQRARVDKLRKELEKLDQEDDQIIRCSRRYELEKEIFDIEHPREDFNDWSAWEEEDEE